MDSLKEHSFYEKKDIHEFTYKLIVGVVRIITNAPFYDLPDKKGLVPSNGRLLNKLGNRIKLTYWSKYFDALIDIVRYGLNRDTEGNMLRHGALMHDNHSQFLDNNYRKYIDTISQLSSLIYDILDTNEDMFPRPAIMDNGWEEYCTIRDIRDEYIIDYFYRELDRLIKTL